MTITELSELKIPFVGVGCIVTRAHELLLVRSHAGFWGPPGGHLDFGESPEDCAARETREETGVRVTNVDFVAVTNDLCADTGKHYVTLWMRADAAAEAAAAAGDPAEIADVGWFPPGALPKPWFLCFENLPARRCLPGTPANLPFAGELYAAACS